MFVIILTYQQAIEKIDEQLIAHRKFLDRCYQQGFLIVSGPQNPRTGGILISQLKNKSQLEDLLNEDPFAQHKLADYQIIEFDPVKCHPNFVAFLG